MSATNKPQPAMGDGLDDVANEFGPEYYFGYYQGCLAGRADSEAAAATIATLQAEKVDLKEQLQFAAELAAERGKAIATYEAKLKRVTEALRVIEGLEPHPFNGFPDDWSEQIEACSECQAYRGHPIQQGICDTHRRPLWDRERHGKHEEAALGYRAKTIARAALSNQGER